jgi:hypothetical protein
VLDHADLADGQRPDCFLLARGPLAAVNRTMPLPCPPLNPLLDVTNTLSPISESTAVERPSAERVEIVGRACRDQFDDRIDHIGATDLASFSGIDDFANGPFQASIFEVTDLDGQTKKFRPVLPVLPLLKEWLTAELNAYLALPEEQRPGRGWLVNYYSRPVQDVGGAWQSMLKALDLPTGREWQPYVLRHSLATLARNAGATKWDLKGFMGHRSPSQTEVYAIGEFPTVETALLKILEEIESLVPGALHRRSTGAGHPVTSAEGRKMTR